MSGLYLHIPFCKQACHYCNFHFSTSLKYKGEMVAAIIEEMALQKDYLKDKKLNSIYFGGGTPSLLEQKELEDLFAAIHQHFEVAPDAEITLEANPDDLLPPTLKNLAASSINRLSIGIQSFSEEDLRFMNRAHTAQEAAACVALARDAGFEQFTIDLIYGAPTTSDAQWAKNLEMAFALDIPHLSAYCLTVEPGTALGHFVQSGKAPPVDELKAARQLDYLIKATQAAGYTHYEISNFAKPGYYAKHNSAYWLGTPYLGLGPSAHSFNGQSRQWNVAHNAQYLKAIAAGNLPFEIEQLSAAQKYNEYVMTGLRTIWGVSLDKLEAMGAAFAQHFQTEAQVFLSQGEMEKSDQVYRLTTEGKFIADRIAMELFVEEEE